MSTQRWTRTMLTMRAEGQPFSGPALPNRAQIMCHQSLRTITPTALLCQLHRAIFCEQCQEKTACKSSQPSDWKILRPHVACAALATMTSHDTAKLWKPSCVGSALFRSVRSSLAPFFAKGCSNDLAAWPHMQQHGCDDAQKLLDLHQAAASDS